MLRSNVMKARKISQKQLIDMITTVPSGVALTPTAKLKWDVAVLVADCNMQKNRFIRSVSDHVDANSKKANFLLAISHLFDAIREDDYQNVLVGSAIGCKVAHSFKFEGKPFKVWELKSSNKDRIYFYATDLEAPRRKTIFLLMAYHKKDQTTPAEVSTPCEDDIKAIIKTKGKIEFCEVKNG